MIETTIHLNLDQHQVPIMMGESISDQASEWISNHISGRKIVIVTQELLKNWYAEPLRQALEKKDLQHLSLHWIIVNLQNQ